MSIDSIASSGSTRPSDRSVVGADSSVARSAARTPASDVDTRSAVGSAAALPTDDQLTKAVADLNKAAQDNAQGLEFSIDKDSKRTVVKVIDQTTKEVLRQIPTPEALEIAKSLDKVQQGFLIKQTA